MAEKLLRIIIVIAILLVVVDVIGFNQVLELRAEEPRRAIVAVEMMESGDYIVPHIFDEPYYNKPPVYNWMIAGSMTLFGTGEFAARLPGALSFLAMGLIIFIMMKQFTSKPIALLGAFAFLTIGELLFYGAINAAEIDLFFSLLILLQAWSIFHFRQKEDYLRLFLFSYLITAVALLTKSIPALAFQACTLAVYLIATKRFRKLFSWQHLVGILAFTSVIVAYLYAYSKQGNMNGFLANLFSETSMQTANEKSLLSVFMQMLLFPLQLLKLLLPWSILVLLFFVKEVRVFIRKNALLHFSMIFILANVIFYWTASDLRNRYVYMFFPFFIMLFVGALEAINWSSFRWKKGITYVIGIGVLLAAAGIFALPFLLKVASPFTICATLLIGSAIIWLAVKLRAHQNGTHVFWFFILTILLARLTYNIIALPAMPKLDEGLKYRKLVAEMVEAADGHKIIYAGAPELLKPEIQILGNVFYHDTLEVPVFLEFQIPYYYAHYTGEIMTHEKQAKPSNQCYLAYDSYVKTLSGINVLYTITNESTGRQIMLFEFQQSQIVP
jgi:4-amino-4-deoxy-L-arabinose transferase-like glycosyltransferase